jgi:hypothetical protein
VGGECGGFGVWHFCLVARGFVIINYMGGARAEKPQV